MPQLKHINLLFYFSLIVTNLSCEKGKVESEKRFSLLPSQTTNIAFTNQLTENEQFNIINYLYFYNGGGVAVGDLNNDSLPDLYFTANMLPNQLYLNEGDFQFEDITKQTQTGGGEGWDTGVSMADVNGDGWLDIYVCQVGDYLGLKGRNELYINQGVDKNGVPHFEEKAAGYGLDFQGFSTQAAFFDYDRDGDLDMYLLNHSVHSTRSYGNAKLRYNHDEKGGDVLYRNDGGKFVDVTKESGIYNSTIGYGLGITLGDVNQDGWADIYIANDFHENDYLYYNNRDGTFKEGLTFSMGHTSRFSMGTDIADFNNDGRLDVISLDMKPQKEEILKSSVGEDAFDIFQLKLRLGYHYQYARNHLQLNQGTPIENGAVKFSEIGQLSGVDATDWSWSALFADLDNDGYKDLFISNGIFRRPNDLDYLNYISPAKVQQSLEAGIDDNNLEVVLQMPSVPLSNYAYQNQAFNSQNQLAFSDQAKSWGLDHKGFSNGTTYADLDNDGDLDLVINNVNASAGIYRNNAEKFEANAFLKVKLQGEKENRQGIGAKVLIKDEGKQLYQELFPTRGFQSSVETNLHFGLGKISSDQFIDSLWVIWQNARFQLLTNIPINQMLLLHEKNAESEYLFEQRENLPKATSIQFRQISINGINYKHQENNFDDFNRERFIPHKVSTEGPALAVGDVNNDGLDDFFVGGAKLHGGRLFLQKDSKTADQPTFYPIPENDALFFKDGLSEDIDAEFLDVEGDGDLDLYVVSGGSELTDANPALADRLYLNDGRGNFSKSENSLPSFFANGSCVASADFDQDGDMDLFIGSRSVSGKYGLTPKSHLLKNNGNGSFEIDTQVQKLTNIGLVTDATWADFNQDGWLDLLVVGEWMSPQIFFNQNGQLTLSENGIENANGWWNSVLAEDLDGDGDVDFVAGNLGLNSDLKASAQEPLQMYVTDLDNNGSIEQLISIYKESLNGIRHPYTLASRDELVKQLPSLRKRFETYTDFSKLKFDAIFTQEELAKAELKTVQTFATTFFENKGNGIFQPNSLPLEAQLSPTYGIYAQDFNQDNQLDLVLGGNFSGVPPSIGKYDASYGMVLLNEGKGQFKSIANKNSNLWIEGEVKAIKSIVIAEGRKGILIAKNNGKIGLWIGKH